MDGEPDDIWFVPPPDECDGDRQAVSPPGPPGAASMAARVYAAAARAAAQWPPVEAPPPKRKKAAAVLIAPAPVAKPRDRRPPGPAPVTVSETLDPISGERVRYVYVPTGRAAPRPTKKSAPSAKPRAAPSRPRAPLARANGAAKAPEARKKRAAKTGAQVLAAVLSTLQPGTTVTIKL